jgi:cell division GTPase FtsZ
VSDFDFIEHFDAPVEVKNEEQLDDNEAVSAINCAFVGFGGGGGKLAKAFLELGFNKTLLINTTAKDQPADLDSKHLVIVPDADGVAKNIEFGKEVLSRKTALSSKTP